MKDKDNGSFVGEVVDETKKAGGEFSDAALRKFSEANLSRLMILGDPLGRLQAMEVALLVNYGFVLAAVGVSAWLGWSTAWLLVAGFLFVNSFFLLYKYVQWRKEYLAGGGEL